MLKTTAASTTTINGNKHKKVLVFLEKSLSKQFANGVKI